MTTFRCPSDILITSCWLFTARWSTWPENHLHGSMCGWGGRILPLRSDLCISGSSWSKVPLIHLVCRCASLSTIPYAEACCMLAIQSLADRRSELFSNRLLTMSYPVFINPLPAKRDTQLISRLRSTMVYPTFRARTNRFKISFLPYCLSN